MDELAVVIAGEPVAVRSASLAAYITRHRKTVQHYDLLTEPRTVGPELIRATRSPYMGSRISEAQARWFIERAASAPWSEVPTGAALVEADPVERGGLYDAAVRLYDHFRDDSPGGVGVAKRSKVLHLMRPALVPILDSRLLATYRTASAEVAVHVGQQRPDVEHRRMYWSAIRGITVRPPELNGSQASSLRRGATRRLRADHCIGWKGDAPCVCSAPPAPRARCRHVVDRGQIGPGGFARRARAGRRPAARG